MSAANPQSVAARSKDALRASASASVAASAASPATAVSSSLSPSSAVDELAAVKQRITQVEGDIDRVEKQLAAAIEKRDRFDDDETKWQRCDHDVQRLAKEKEQLRSKEALLLKEKQQLRDELNRKERVLQNRTCSTTGQYQPTPGLLLFHSMLLCSHTRFSIPFVFVRLRVALSRGHNSSVIRPSRSVAVVRRYDKASIARPAELAVRVWSAFSSLLTLCC